MTRSEYRIIKKKTIESKRESGGQKEKERHRKEKRGTFFWSLSGRTAEEEVELGAFLLH